MWQTVKKIKGLACLEEMRIVWQQSSYIGIILCWEQGYAEKLK